MSAAAVELQGSEDFEARMLEIVNGGALALMLSVGHRTGLFDVMAKLPPSSSAQIAKQAGLSERYVREWLGAMVTADVVRLSDPPGHYHLPPEHAAALTREAGGDNLAMTCQWIPLLGSVEDEIVECFQQGGGVPYSSYGRFHAVMAEESDQTVVAALVDLILPSVPGLVEALEAGIQVLDLGCGSGRALHRMAETWPRSRFSGYDFSPESVGRARREAADRGLTNTNFEVRDAARLGDRERFDLITAFDAIHDQAQPAQVLAGIARALRPEGTFLMQEIAGSGHLAQDAGHPMGTFLYTISCLHCMTVSLANDGAGLGAMWGAETATRMLGEAGFARVERRELPHDIMNHYYTARK